MDYIQQVTSLSPWARYYRSTEGQLQRIYDIYLPGDNIEYDIELSNSIIVGSCGDMSREIVEEPECYRNVSR